MKRALVALFTLLAPRIALGAPVVWVVDDGEKIKQDDAPTIGLATGAGNPVWSPGQPVRLFALKNETVSLQIVVAADGAPLTGVTVDLETLASPAATIANAAAATDPTRFVGRPIERFVEHFFDIARPSGGKDPKESLGWFPGSGPAPGRWTGKIPDALIPVEVAPAWSPYPMTIAAHANGIVWIDVTTTKAQAPGLYRGTVVVKAGGTALASLPVELDVADVTLADRPLKTMLFYEKDELARRIGASGADAAERHLFQLYHRHRLSPMHSANSRDDVTRALSALDGSLYTTAAGYQGPAEGLGDGVLSLGTYGNLGEPDAQKLRVVEGIADLLEDKRLLATTDTFVYATDEDCQSPYGKAWKQLLAGSANPRARKVRVAWTCSEDAAKQPVDIPIQAASFDAAKTAKARQQGKEVWAYNGRMPQTGSFFTDTPAISLRVNGWLAATSDIGRWFYWETTFWYDGNKGGHGPYDPFVTAETFHNRDGDYAMGDGVLVYPGKQVDRFTEHSVGMDGVIASIRLKNWRRGIEDAGYYQLAHAIDAKRAEAIAKGLLPAVHTDARDGKPPSWSESGQPFFEARRALLAVIRGTAPSSPTLAPPSTAKAGPEHACGCRGCNQSGSALFVVGMAVMVARRARRRR